MLVDFPEVKQRVPILEVARYLAFTELVDEGSRHRGVCPYCDDRRSFTVTPNGGKDGLGMSGCFKCGNSKDSIALVMHFKGISNPREAAIFILETFGHSTIPVGNSNVPKSRNSSVPDARKGTVPPPAPKPAPAPVDDTDTRLEKVAARLLFDHQDVQALGLTPEMAERLGVGYDKRGVLKGRVLFPLYDDGELAGFMGFAHDLVPIIKFPSQLVEERKSDKVVPIRKAS